MNFPDHQPVPLWTGAAPLSHGNAECDIPTIKAVYPPLWNNKHAAVIILPGGGYAMLADHEGTAYADFLAQQGFTCFVVKYRLGADGYHHPAEISDAARAVRLVRTHAEELGIRRNHIGIMGSSAGGHLAASCATFHELGLREAGESAEKDLGRPDFSILCYPVISGVEPYSHFGSFEYLLGKPADPELQKKLSMEKSVDAHTPPAFIWHTVEDNCVPVENSLAYAAALRKYQIPFDLHLYQRGHHGIGLCGGHPWAAECVRFLNDQIL